MDAIYTPNNTPDLAEIDAMVERIGRRPQDLIPLLQAIQNHYRWLPPEALARLCEITDITPEAVSGVSTFYHQFRHHPVGRHIIKTCIGTACHVKGAQTLDETFRMELRIPEGEFTDSDGLFSVEQVACLGCCMLAPVVQIDEVIYGFVTPAQIPELLQDFLASEQRDHRKKIEVETRKHKAVGEARICLCSSCVAGGSRDVYKELEAVVGSLDLPVRIKEVGCTGFSFQTPRVEIALSDGHKYRYGLVKPPEVRDLLLRHFRPAGLIRRLGAVLYRAMEQLLTDEAWEPPTRFSKDVRATMDARFADSQVRVVTEHAGIIEPADIDDYLAHDGFVALTTTLKEKTPDEVIAEVLASGLRGRGGAGFPTGRKWELTRSNKKDQSYIICNGDEGDPGAFMDRMILESFPFRVLEGMAVAAYAIGADRGFLYIRAEYPLAAQRIREAIAVCEERGYLGADIMGSGFHLRLEVVEGAGAFVCGEETALMSAIEGGRGMPRFRPPYPAEAGLWGKPTLINNVETLGLVPWIMRNGADRFAALGTGQSKGTKTFALAGKVRRGGLIEVPMGMSLREIVEDIGGGIPDGRKLKAVLVGGPSGGCVPAQLASTPVDYEALVGVGAIMGSGGMVVLDETDCMVDIARYFMSFCRDESCGKCTHCRVGTKLMEEILGRICEGKGRKGDIEKLEELAGITIDGSLCGLGKTAPNPVMSTLRHFREEYVAHINGECPARKCKAFIQYSINLTCIGCTRCAQGCPTSAIPMNPYHQHEIEEPRCIRCDICYQVCPVDAIEVVSL